jgi:hypothetical protein
MIGEEDEMSDILVMFFVLRAQFSGSFHTDSRHV